MENGHSPQALFSQAFSYDGRIRRLEYSISVLLACFVVYLCICIPDTFFLRADSVSDFDLWFLINTVSTYVRVIACWFLMAQATKRCHDSGHSGWFLFIPFYILVLLFEKGEPSANKYGYPPKQAQSVDIQSKSDNIIKDQNSFATFFLLLLMLLKGGNFLLTFILLYRLLFGELYPELITDFIDAVLSLSIFIGVLLVFHYKKLGFYIAVFASSVSVIRWFYNMCVNEEVSFGSEPIYNTYNLIVTIGPLLGFVALYLVMKKKRNGVSIWEKMRFSLKSIDWRSLGLYLFTFEAAALIYGLLY